MVSFLLALLLGAAFGLQGAIQPGPLMAVLISESVNHGRKAGMKIGLIPLLTDPPVLLLALVVVASVSELFLGVISLLGAILLIRLGRLGLRNDDPDDRFRTEPAAKRTFAAAVALNFLNPNLYLYSFMINAPQVIACWKQGGFVPAVGYVAAFFAAIAAANALLAILAGIFHQNAPARFLLWLNRLLSGLMFLMAGFFLFRAGKYILFYFLQSQK